MHTHYTSGMASMTVLKAIEAGVDVVDACLAPLALRTSQPALEPLVVTFQGTERDSGLSSEKLLKMGDYLETILPKYSEHMESTRAAVIDARVLSHQIPGGMASNLISQLREADAVDRLDEVLSEIPRVRKELGYPPMVTPMSQMIGTQSVGNVLFGRYKMVFEQVKDYAYGLYGRPPAPLDPDVAELALKDYERGNRPIADRPADLIEPEMANARETIADISTDLEDVLTYALFPTTGLSFLKMKHGLEPVPDDMKPVSPGQVTALTVRRGAADAPSKSPRARAFNVFLGEEFYRVEVDPVQEARPSATPAAVAPAGPAAAEAVDSKPDVPIAAPNEAAITAPLPGVLLKHVVEIGETVNVGDPVVVLEAMKMENTLPSPIAGRVKALPLEPGARVAKDDVLAIISP